MLYKKLTGGLGWIYNKEWLVKNTIKIKSKKIGSKILETIEDTKMRAFLEKINIEKLKKKMKLRFIPGYFIQKKQHLQKI